MSDFRMADSNSRQTREKDGRSVALFGHHLLRRYTHTAARIPSLTSSFWTTFLVTSTAPLTAWPIPHTIKKTQKSVPSQNPSHVRPNAQIAANIGKPLA